MEETQIGVVLTGAGAVGFALLNVVERSFTSLRVVAVGDSRGFVVNHPGFSWPQVHEILQHKASGNTITSWDLADGTERAEALLPLVEDLAHAESKVFGNYIVVDCTSSQATAPALLRAKQCGFGVVMANKLPLSLTTEVYNNLVFDAAGTRSPLVQYEATVGAGLPVVNTLKRIVASRDRIISVQGSFSGTIGYVLAEMNGGKTFSEALNAAHALGITEPDPRDDLSGADVARKMVILARELGFETETTSVEIEKLLPDAFLTLPVPVFLSKISELDPVFHERRQAAAVNHNASRLAYLGTITSTGALSIALEIVPRTSVFANTSSTENAMEVLTQWFPEPLVLRGTGAGIHSTAAALAADLAQIAAAFARC